MYYSTTFYIGIIEDSIELLRNKYDGFETTYRSGDNKEKILYSKDHPYHYRGDNNNRLLVINTVLGETYKIPINNIVSIKSGVIHEQVLNNSENSIKSDHNNEITEEIIGRFYFVNSEDTVVYSERFNPSNILTPVIFKKFRKYNKV